MGVGHVVGYIRSLAKSCFHIYACIRRGRKKCLVYFLGIIFVVRGASERTRRSQQAGPPLGKND